MFKNKKIIVVGGAGFVGSHLTDALIALGAHVHIIDDLSTGKKEHCHNDAVLHEIDICDRSKLDEIFKESTYVFHLAASVLVPYSIEHPVETHNINVTGTLNVLEASQKAKVERLVFSSSSAVYGDQDRLPLVESMEVSPQSPYALHKYFGERMCVLWGELYGLNTVSLRYFNIYGTRQNPGGSYAGAIARFLKLHTEGKTLPITGDGEQTRDFIAVEDVVQANIKAVLSTKIKEDGGVINIGSGKGVSVNELAEMIGGATEHIAKRHEPKDSVADITKAKQLLDWSPEININDGLRALKQAQGLC